MINEKKFEWILRIGVAGGVLGPGGVFVFWKSCWVKRRQKVNRPFTTTP